VTPHFHIFKCESDGTVIWWEAVETLEIARSRAQTLAAFCPGALDELALHEKHEFEKVGSVYRWTKHYRFRTR
jgi:hypothetical protein